MLELLSYGFVQKALIGGIIISLCTSLIGVFLVIKRMSLLGDSFAHASFTGIAIGYVLNINPMLSALVFIVCISIGLNKLISKTKLYSESALAVMLSFSLSLALILISVANEFSVSLFTYLFGSLLTVNYTDIIVSTFVLLLIIIFYYFNYSTLFYTSFNQEIAQIRRKNSSLVEKLFIILCAITVVIAIKAVGILLVSALLVVPALIGIKLSNSLKHSFVISSVVSIFSIILGVLLSFYFDLPSGGVIVLSLVLFFFSIISYQAYKK